jgi:CRISPR system Cascade subunit CasA
MKSTENDVAANSAYIGEAPSELVSDESGFFDLVTEAWIPVVGLDGVSSRVGLEDVVLQAHRIQRIAAEAPTMTAALYRLVLALFHRVYGPPSEARWRALWEDTCLPAKELRDYMGRFRDRFSLFHPQRPFMQCAALSSLAPSTPGKLVPYRAVGNNVTLFDHTTSADQILLSADEAARWLVAAQAFDPGGMKTPYEKDKSSERGPCNHFGVVLVEGANLKETLLLNALVYQPDYEKPPMTTAEDRPVWEEDTGPSPKPDKRVPRGWTDLLTWPSRRVLLSTHTTGETMMVDGVVVTPGVRLDSRLPDEEKMAAFRQPRNEKGKPKRDAPMLPIRLHPVRGIWRHSVELLMIDAWEEGKSRQRPPALDQVSELTDRGYIPEDTVYTLRVFGQQLDSKASVVEAWLEDEVVAPVALLRTRDERLGGLIGCAIAFADDAGSALRTLQNNYRKELRAGPASDIDLSYWPPLSRPFNEFLVELSAAQVAKKTERPVSEEWGRKVTQMARSVADRWISGSPEEASKIVVLGRQLGLFRSRLATAHHAYLREIASYVN